jgi:DNA-binding transcriptional LysR family regulator
MDAGDLRIFEAVARLGGMNRAAAELHTVQSNVTARIRQLEAELGVTLFERHSRGATPTAAGRRLLPHAVRVGQALEEARRAVCADGQPAGGLVIGSLETTAALRLSPLLADFAAIYPDVDLVLRTGTTAEMIDAVLARAVEGAFVCGPVDHPALTQHVAFREEMVVATHPSVASLDALARADRVKIVVLRAGCSYRQRLEDILARRGVVGLRQLEFGTLDSIVGCVAAGLGVTLLPRGVLAAAARDGRVALHPLPAPETVAETLFIRRRDGAVSAALGAFIGHVSPAAVPDAAE